MSSRSILSIVILKVQKKARTNMCAYNNEFDGDCEFATKIGNQQQVNLYLYPQIQTCMNK